jgi:signal transduction histidine kinase
VQGILADEKNNVLWLSTFAGISRFNLKDMKFTNFSLRDGIQGLLYADGSCLKTSGNYFIFGGNNGITWFNPDEIAKSSLPPKVYITEFNVADESIDLNADAPDLKSTKEITKLSHHQNNVSFDYTGIQYDNPSRNTFAYKLENYDDTWREVGSQRSAFYYNLPPGKFTFRVKAANSNGIWNEEGASINFEIAPPWWLTWWAYVIYGILFVVAIFAFDRIQRRRLVEKARREAKEKELAQAREIEKAYTKLKDTQTQLIQAEKMASLGELTAGIAHEIQNPLNFVNNFSEVNAELIDELEEEAEEGNLAEVKEIAKDIKENEEKILYHGKRADAIVKGMLQHSRTSSGQKESTDINALADEYLRLSYHGLRAKDKNFNADFKTDLDETIPPVMVIPQDFGRVLLNLINNAFYAVHEKTLTGFGTLSGLESYKPLVTLASLNLSDSIEIRVKDNGNGIPADIKDKIFQPFFTTKPTGEGTGLGLSMSYDIITKGHGGEIKVETKQGKGSEFVIVLPLKLNNDKKSQIS